MIFCSSACVASSRSRISMAMAPCPTAGKKISVPIHIHAKNNGTVAATGTVTLYKDGEVLEVWHNVQFDLKKRRSVKLVYLYDPSGDGGRRVVWKASISADGDSKSRNNTAGTVKTRIKRCH